MISFSTASMQLAEFHQRLLHKPLLAEYHCCIAATEARVLALKSSPGTTPAREFIASAKTARRKTTGLILNGCIGARPRTNARPDTSCHAATVCHDANPLMVADF